MTWWLWGAFAVTLGSVGYWIWRDVRRGGWSEPEVSEPISHVRLVP